MRMVENNFFLQNHLQDWAHLFSVLEVREGDNDGPAMQCNARNAKNADQLCEKQNMNIQMKKGECKKEVKDDLQPATSGPVCILAAPWTYVISVEKKSMIKKVSENDMQPEPVWEKYQSMLHLFAYWDWYGALWEPATIDNSFGAIHLQHFSMAVDLIS